MFCIAKCLGCSNLSQKLYKNYVYCKTKQKYIVKKIYKKYCKKKYL